MKVIDASVLLPALVDEGSEGESVRSATSNQDLFAPELIDLEMISAVRRMVRQETINLARASLVLGDLAGMAMIRSPHLPLLSRIWELRNNLSAYDASYVALAETLNAPLLTADKRLASAPGIRCEVELIA